MMNCMILIELQNQNHFMGNWRPTNVWLGKWKNVISNIWGDIKNRSLLLFCWGFTMRSKGNFRKSWYYSITRTDFVWVDVNKSCRNAMYLHPFNALNAKFIHQHQIEYQPVPSTIVSHVKLLSVDRMQKTQSITSHHHQQQHQDHIKTSPDVLNL